MCLFGLRRQRLLETRNDHLARVGDVVVTAGGQGQGPRQQTRAVADDRPDEAPVRSTIGAVDPLGSDRPQAGDHLAQRRQRPGPGRLRTGKALAEMDTLVLEIDAEDFFDLLANNIEIVKALFRQLLRDDDSG